MRLCHVARSTVRAIPQDEVAHRLNNAGEPHFDTWQWVPHVMRWHPRAVQLDRPDRDMCHDLTVDAIPQNQHAHGINKAGVRTVATWQVGPDWL